jgi:hypothetical protein
MFKSRLFFIIFILITVIVYLSYKHFLKFDRKDNLLYFTDIGIVLPENMYDIRYNSNNDNFFGEDYVEVSFKTDENGQPNWNKPISQDIANIGTQQGFSWGGSWTSFKDYPHFEMSFGQSIKNLMGTLNK